MKLSKLSLCMVLGLLHLSVVRAEETLWPDLATPPQVGGGQAEAAVIIALEDYVILSDIPGARRNGLDWHTYFTDGRGISPDRVKLVTDNAATKEGIAQAIADTIAAVPAGGTVWFVFIGHGAPSKDGADGLLVGWDTQQTADSVYARGLKQSEVLAMLESGRHKSTVAIIDACFSGMTDQDQRIASGLMPVVPSYAIPSVQKTTLITAGGSDQFAGPLPGLERPGFSYLALGALYGWGDKDENGQMTASEVQAYTMRTLASLPLGRKQTPTIVGNGNLSLGPAKRNGPDISTIQRSLESQRSGVSQGRAGGWIVDPKRYDIANDGIELLEEALKTKTIDEIRAAAEAGDGESMYLVALSYWNNEADRDMEAYVHWCRRASARGFVRAQAAFGVRLLYGQGIPKNEDEGIQWIEIAAESGSGWALNTLGEVYYSGEIIEEDIEKSRQYFLRGHQTGFSSSTVWLGHLEILHADQLQQSGDEVAAAQAARKGIAYYEEAVAKKNSWAQFRLAEEYYKGKWIGHDPQLAISLYSASAEAGEWRAVEQLVNIYTNVDEKKVLPDTNPNKAAYFLGLFVKNGDLEAKNMLADLIRDHGVQGTTIQTAIQLWKEAFAEGSCQAALRLASLYNAGERVPKNLPLAVEYAEKGLTLWEQMSPDSEDAYPMNGVSAAHILVDAYGSGAVAAPPGRLEDLRRRYGTASPMKKFTVPVTCGSVKAPYDFYVWDWGREETPVDIQSVWLKETRGCITPQEVLDSFKKLQDLARKNSVSYAELCVYALEAANKEKGK